MSSGPNPHVTTDAPPGEVPPAAVVLVDVVREEEPLDPRLVTAPLNDSAHAVLFAERFGREFAHVPGLGWHRFNGRYWARDAVAEAQTCAWQIIESRMDALTRFADSTDDDAAQAEAVVKRRRLEKHGNSGGLDGIVKVAANRLNVSAARFDCHPWLLNVENGVVDLHTGALLPHDPLLYQTQCNGVVYDPEARSELWMNTVREMANDDEALAAFLQIIGGLAASGAVPVQKFFYYFGEGANGKSLLTDLMADALGGFGDTGYAVRLPCETVAGHRERTAGAPSPDLLALRGKRLALFDEQNGDKAFNPERLKNLTGGDSLTARAPHKANGVTFTPTWTLIGVGNHKPLVHASDHGVWRRMALVPFQRTFLPTPESLRLPETLRCELPAILTWMVGGSMRYHIEGYKEPDVVIRESRLYQVEADLMRQWLEDRAGGGDRAGEEDGLVMHKEFVAWCEERRELVISHSLFSRRLKQLRWTSRKSNGRVLWGRPPEPSAPDSGALGSPAPHPSE